MLASAESRTHSSTQLYVKGAQQWRIDALNVHPIDKKYCAHPTQGHSSAGFKLHGIQSWTMSEMQMDDSRDCKGRAALLSFRSCALILGCICGVFVHMSSLAATYFLTFQHPGQDSETIHLNKYDDKQVILANLVWSLLTSAIAFTLLGVLRTMIGPNQTTVLAQLDVFFSTGALGGLCASWIATDIALGLQMHRQTTIFLFILVTLAGFKGLTSIRFDCQANQQDQVIKDAELAQPLLEDVETASLPSESSSSHDKAFRWIGLQCGVLIGIFIQLSGLGGNSLLRYDDHAEGTGRRLMLFVALSFLTSCLGIMALLFIRQLLAHTLPQIATSSLIVFECFFASGATVGLNLAWAVTDFMLGMEPHLLGAAISTLMSLAWCKLVLSCCADGLQDCKDDSSGREEQYDKVRNLGKEGVIHVI